MTVDDLNCDRPDISLWYDTHDGDRQPATPGSTLKVWIIDVNGARVVIDSEAPTPPLASLQPGDDPNGAAGDINAIVGSIRIVAVPTDVINYFDQVRGICDSATRRFQTDPAVVGGFREQAPEFTDLDDAAAHAAAVVGISDAALRDVRAIPVPPELVDTRVGEAYAVLESAVDLMRQVPAAARAGDEGLVSSLMSEAYQLTNFGSINPDNGAELIPDYEPLGLGLLAPSISGCRLPSGGG